jgi:lipase
VKLHVHEWGDPDAPPLICLHGVTGHGERYRRLAEEHWAKRFHVIAPDLRGHGRSGWEPPWTYPTYVEDLVETADALGIDAADWVGHSFGGRLVLELVAAHPERVSRAVLLDPAIQVLPHIALQNAEHQLAEPIYASVEEYADARGDGSTTPRALVLEDGELHCERLPDGRLRRRTCQPAMVSIYGEIATVPPPPETLTVPTLLIYAPAYGLVQNGQLAAYADHAELVAVPGMHMVMWDAYDEVVAAGDAFLT